VTDVLCSCHAELEPQRRTVFSCGDPRQYACARAEDFGVKPSQLLSSDRSQKMVAFRARVATELRAFGFSLPEIGRALNRHHTSVLYLLLRESEAA
jgi:Bacterial dnaA protein helix-turn-helix